MRTRDWATVDFYAVLGVEPTATADDVNLAFRALAKRLHPDRVGDASRRPSSSSRSPRPTTCSERAAAPELRPGADRCGPEPRRRAGVTTRDRAPRRARRAARVLAPEVVRRNGRRWIAAGVAVSLIGMLVATLIVHLQIDERTRRAGRVKTDAVLVVSPTRSDVRFTTATGEVVQVAEPARVNPGAERNGQRIAVLYRPDRPTDVIIDESTAARDITLWIVALKLLVGGPSSSASGSAVAGRAGSGARVSAGAVSGHGRACSSTREPEADVFAVAVGHELQPDRQAVGRHVRPAPRSPASPRGSTSIANGTDMPACTRRPMISVGIGPSAANAGIAAIGVASTSTESNTSAIASSIASRCRSTAPNFGSVTRAAESKPGRTRGSSSSARSGQQPSGMCTHVSAPLSGPTPGSDPRTRSAARRP